MTKKFSIRINDGIPYTKDLARSLASSAGLMKELMGVANNAAWLICLDAHDKLKRLHNWNQKGKGGHTVRQLYQRPFDALHDYERRLIYDNEFRFFDINDMPEKTRKMYGDITNREYYDFWAAIGSSTYERMKPLVTSLWNKYRLALLHGGVKGNETIAWSMTAQACLNSAVTIYCMSLDMISNEFGLPRNKLEKCFFYFSLKDVSKLWEDALSTSSPEAYCCPLSSTDSANIDVGIRQIMESWTEGDKIYDDMQKTLLDFGEDVMKTKGYIQKAINEVRGLRDYHDSLP